MKTSFIYTIAVFLLLLAACEKDLLETTIGEGKAPVLTTSGNTIILVHEDSANMALTLNWTNPNYLKDTTNGDLVGTYELDLDVDAAFANAKSFSMVNIFQKSFSVFELNKIMLDLGCETDIENTVYVRVKSIFFQEDTLLSNTEPLTVTPYSTVIPPAIEVPQEVWISGEALTTGWNAPFLPEQQFTKETETSFSITIDLLGGKEYEMITDGAGVNWTPVYRLDPSNVPADLMWGGDFVWDGDGSDYGWSSLKFLSPPDDGTYKIILNFQDATFTVIDASGPPVIAVPEEVWISGDALEGGWIAPFPADRQFTKEGKTKFSLTIKLLADMDYEMITDGQGVNWTPCYRIDPNLDPAALVYSGGFVWDGDGSDFGWGSKKFKSPPTEGVYKITLDFQTATYVVAAQ